jgi:hypothetical protein
MSDDPVLEDLPFDELRQRALALAKKRHDVKFMVSLIAHTPAATAVAGEGGSLGDISGSIAETVEAAEEVFGKHSVGDAEQLFRARFAEYIREHQDSA